MLTWQFRQPRPTVPSSEVLVVRPVGSEPAWLGWLELLWHSWHRNGGRCLSRLAIVVPCGSWQMAQLSCTGGWLFTNGPRFSMWQVKQVSLTVSRTSCLGVPLCTLWHDEQAILPSTIGWCTGRLIWTRCSLWQVKQVSGCVYLSRTGSRAAWALWHELQSTSRLACTLMFQSTRLPPWWQLR